MKFTTKQEMISYLFSRRRMNIKLGLDNINHLLDVLDRPEQQFSSIHVAGTNGKGSTCAMLESIYNSAGYKTGLYTSPHLSDVRERIRINKKMASIDVFQKTLATLLPTIEKYGCSFFEILTAIAFAHFREEKVDIALIETGLGGRLDATNVLTPKLSLITEIDIDHVKQLGNSHLEIAREKAGIIKPNVPVLSSASKQQVLDFFSSFCEDKQVPFFSSENETEVENISNSENWTSFDLITPQKKWSEVKLSLFGKHQVQNAVGAIRAVEILRKTDYPIDRKTVYSGLKNVNWKGRLQILQKKPTVIVDVAHNLQGINTAIKEIINHFSNKKIYCVFGVLGDKKYQDMLDSLNPFIDSYITVTPDNERALPAEELAENIKKNQKTVFVGQTISDGLQKALNLAEPNDLICVLGSHFIVGEILSNYKIS